ALVHRLAGNLGALPPDVVDEIVERTDGVPLFVEEMTKAVVEAGADRGYASMAAVPPSSLAVPATLHASLLGRLDRLPPPAQTNWPGGGGRRRPNICSSTRWSRTPPTPRCCAARARLCIAASPRGWNSGFRTSSKPGR